MQHRAMIAIIILLSFIFANSFQPVVKLRKNIVKSAQKMSGIEEIVENYDIFLLDMWGVMHDGIKPYEGVLETIQGLKKEGKDLIILSNSSKRQDSCLQMLEKLGFNPTDFLQVITSGEVAYQMLVGNNIPGCKSWPALEAVKEKTVLVLGSGSEDETYCTSSGWILAPVENANLIVARGMFNICNGEYTVDKKDGERAYFAELEEVLKIAAQRRIPMLVSNPDKIRPDVSFTPMPGALADQYAQLLSEVDAEILIKRIGKPFHEVYDLALQGKERSRACMVGDALETDVTGGSLNGIATIWVVNNGIHGLSVQEHGDCFEEGTAFVLSDFNLKNNTYAMSNQLEPSVIIPSFQW